MSSVWSSVGVEFNRSVKIFSKSVVFVLGGGCNIHFLLDDWVGANLFCSLFHRVSGLVFNKKSSVKDCYAFERNNEY